MHSPTMRQKSNQLQMIYISKYWVVAYMFHLAVLHGANITQDTQVIPQERL